MAHKLVDLYAKVLVQQTYHDNIFPETDDSGYIHCMILQDFTELSYNL